MFVRGSFLFPLPHGFVHEDGGADTDVEGVEASQHGDTDMGIGSLAPLLGESRRLCSHDDGSGLRHVVVIIFVGVLQLCREDLDVVGLEEGNSLLLRADGGGYIEDATNAGTDEIGIIEVSERVADDNGIHACGLGRTEDGA